MKSSLQRTNCVTSHDGSKIPPQLSLRPARFLAFTAGVGLITFLLFPAAVYYSIIVYGLIASVFMTVGYVIWRELMRTNPRKAMGFSTGFIPPVLLVLGFYLLGTPWLVAAIVAEFLVFSIAISFLWPLRRSPLP